MTVNNCDQGLTGTRSRITIAFRFRNANSTFGSGSDRFLEFCVPVPFRSTDFAFRFRPVPERNAFRSRKYEFLAFT